LRAAVAFEDEDSIVLFDTVDGEWLPAGEVHAPAAGGRSMNLALADDAQHLVTSLSDGTVLKRSLAEGTTTTLASPAAAAAQWHGACSMGGDNVAHLASIAGTAPKLFRHF
jgi:hypothetical protein